jgi:polyisoprenoid-binding protein YceI
LRKTLLASLVLLVGGLVVAGAVFRVLHPPPADNPFASGAPTLRAAGAGSNTALALRKPSPSAEHHDDGKAPAAPVWSVDKEASRLTFRGVMDGIPFDGVFRDWDAQIAFDPKNLKASRATITVNTGSALTGQPIKDQALPNSEWLSTTRFPTATLVTRQIVQTGPGRYLATVDVRIRGIAWRTTVPFVVSIGRDSGRMQSTLTLDRRTFGIGEGPFKSPPPVAPAVQVTMRMVAKKTR